MVDIRAIHGAYNQMDIDAVAWIRKRKKPCGVFDKTKVNQCTKQHNKQWEGMARV